MLATKDLTYQDLNDFFTTEQKGFGFGTSIGAGTDKGETNLHPQGQTTVSLQSTGEEKEQITKATIGNGTIIIGGNEINEANNNLDLIRDLNRDVNNSQEITKDQITGALNGSMTMDNRLFTEGGRNEIASDFENFGKNLGQMYDNITENNIIVQAVKNAATDSETNIFEAVKDYVNDTGKIKDIQNNEELTAKTNGLTNLDAEGVRDTLQDVTNIAAGEDGFKGNIEVYEEYGSGDGYYYSDLNNLNDNTIGVNVRNTDISKSGEVLNVLFHETTNQERHQANEQTALNRGNTAEAIWNMMNYGNQNTSQITGADWLNQNINSSVIQQGNNNYLANAVNYVYNNQDESKSFGQSNQSNFDFNISLKGEHFIKVEEGRVINLDRTHLKYYDGVDKQTIGYGHLLVGNEKEQYNNGITEKQAGEIFIKDLNKVETLMGLLFTRQPEQQEIDAIGSAMFNLGPKFFVRDYKDTKDGSYDFSQINNLLINGRGTTDTFKTFNKTNVNNEVIKQTFVQWGCKDCNEDVVTSIKERRAREADLYNYGVYKNPNIKPANSYFTIPLVNPIDIKIRDNLLKNK